MEELNNLLNNAKNIVINMDVNINVQELNVINAKNLI